MGTGCVQYDVAATTRIAEDGTLTRRFALTGPDDKDSEDGLWKFFAKPGEDGWDPRVITDKRMELTGVFAPKTAIPTHFRLADRQEQAGSESRIKLQCRDYVLIADYRFEETITNNVPYADFRRAGRELVSLYWELAKQAMMEDLGERYELEKLFAFIEGDLAKLAGDLSEAYYWGAALQKSKSEIDRELTEICAAAGTPFDFTQKDNQIMQRVFRLSLRNNLEEYVKMKGAPANTAISPEQLNQLVAYFDLSPQNAFNLALSIQRVALARYGNADELSRRTEKLLKACLGAYHGVPRTRFAFNLEMPGRIIATTGLIEEQARIAWRFEGNNTFPLGYRMSARSILDRREIQQKLAGKALFASSADAVAFLEKGESLDDAELGEFRTAMQTAVDTGDFQPLKAQAASGDNELAKFAGMVLPLMGK